MTDNQVNIFSRKPLLLAKIFFRHKATWLIALALFLSAAGLHAAFAMPRPTPFDRPMATTAAPSIVAYPYLGETTSTSVIIAWALDSGGAGEVRYSTDQSYTHAVAATSGVRDGIYFYWTTIAGLTPGTTYHYKIYHDGNDLIPLATYTFTTAPESGSQSFSFAVLGDSRPSSRSAMPSQSARDIAAELASHDVSLTLHTGDIVYQGGVCTGNDNAWNQYIRAYFDLYRESMAGVPFHPAIGNHELSGGDCGYTSYTEINHLPRNAPAGDEEAYYSFDWGNAHFISIDSTSSNVNSTQYHWLVEDLQNTTKFWKFVFLHYPPYSSGPHGSTSEVQTYLVPLFETYGVDIVFAGHDHHYERTCPIRNGVCTTLADGGVVYYVTGGAGAPLYTPTGDWFTANGGKIHHFLEVKVDDCRLQVDTIQSDGSIFDSFTIDRCNAPSPTPTGTSTPTTTPTPRRARLPLVLK